MSVRLRQNSLEHFMPKQGSFFRHVIRKQRDAGGGQSVCSPGSWISEIGACMSQNKSETGRKGGEQSHGGHSQSGQSQGGSRQREQSDSGRGQAGSERSGSTEQHKKAGEQSHKNQ
jgi:hypothetical protein